MITRTLLECFKNCNLTLGRWFVCLPKNKMVKNWKLLILSAKFNKFWIGIQICTKLYFTTASASIASSSNGAVSSLVIWHCGVSRSITNGLIAHTLLQSVFRRRSACRLPLVDVEPHEDELACRLSISNCFTCVIFGRNKGDIEDIADKTAKIKNTIQKPWSMPRSFKAGWQTHKKTTLTQ